MTRAIRILLALLAATALGATVSGCASSGGAHATASAGPVVPLTADQAHALVSRPHTRATLVNVWATWCGPCREEFPALLEAARAHRSEGLRLVLVSTDATDQLPAVSRFLRAHGVTDTTYLAAGGDMAFIDGLDARWSGALPATFVYDDTGRLQAFWEGAANGARFNHAIQQAFAHSTETEKTTP